MSFKAYLNQNFEELKAKNLANKTLFEDPEFQAEAGSISKFNYFAEWKRPFQICESPKFIVDGINPKDLDQGSLGDAGLIAAMAVCANSPAYINKIVPNDQSFAKEHYAGIFHFRFWNNGEWIDVVIDDRLPTLNNELLFLHNSVEKNEMFPALLEKAYAKLYHGYKIIHKIAFTDGLIDLCGGVHQTFDLQKSRLINELQKSEVVERGWLAAHLDSLWEVMFKAFSLKSLMGGAVTNVEKSNFNNILVKDRVYSILRVVEIQGGNSLRQANGEHQSESLRLILLRDSLGNDKPWNGAWSFDSTEWSKITDDKLLNELKPAKEADGEFILSFEDFVTNFDMLEFVHVDLNAFYEPNLPYANHLNFKEHSFKSEWKINKSTPEESRKEMIDAQYFLKIESDSDKKIQIAVNLMQTSYSKRLFNKEKEIFSDIGFRVYKITDETFTAENGKLETNLGEDKLEKISESRLSDNRRQLTMKFELSPGKYIISPHCTNKEDHAEDATTYLLRLFVEENFDAEKNLESALEEFNKVMSSKACSVM